MTPILVITVILSLASMIVNVLIGSAMVSQKNKKDIEIHERDIIIQDLRTDIKVLTNKLKNAERDLREVQGESHVDEGVPYGSKPARVGGAPQESGRRGRV